MTSSSDLMVIDSQNPNPPPPALALAPPTLPSWRREQERAQLIDALPYFDTEYEDAAVRSEVNRLVQDEMKRSKKRPVDILSELPPVPSLSSESCPMFARELDRVRSGRPPQLLDSSRRAVQPPAGGKQGDMAAWRASLLNAHTQLQHQTVKGENLDLMLQYGANSWRVHNQHLDAFLSRLQSIVEEHKHQIENTNRERKLNQQAAAATLSRLQQQWQEGVYKNFEIEMACQKLEAEIEELREDAKERGIVTVEK